MSVVSANEIPRPAITIGGVIRAVGFIGLGAIGVTVGLSDVLARAPADVVDFGSPLITPSPHFPLGTDILGRDMLPQQHSIAIQQLQRQRVTGLCRCWFACFGP